MSGFFSGGYYLAVFLLWLLPLDLVSGHLDIWLLTTEQPQSSSQQTSGRTFCRRKSKTTVNSKVDTRGALHRLSRHPKTRRQQLAGAQQGPYAACLDHSRARARSSSAAAWRRHAVTELICNKYQCFSWWRWSLALRDAFEGMETRGGKSRTAMWWRLASRPVMEELNTTPWSKVDS